MTGDEFKRWVEGLTVMQERIVRDIAAELLFKDNLRGDVEVGAIRQQIHDTCCEALGMKP